MQPFTTDLARDSLSRQTTPVTIGQSSYRFKTDNAGSWVYETSPNGEKKHKVEHALGGKNVF